MEPDLDHPDPLRALGLPDDASVDDVKAAYRRLLKLHRPESDPEGFQKLRAVYDRARRGASAEPKAPVPRPSPPVERAPRPEPASFVESPDLQQVGDEVARQLDAGAFDVAFQRLVELRTDWKARDPAEWAAWVTDLAEPWLYRKPHEVAIRLVGEASTCLVDDEWLKNRIEAMRLALDLGREVSEAREDRNLPDAFVDFVVAAQGASPPELLEAFRMLHRRRVAERWSLKQAIEYMAAPYPGFTETWFGATAGVSRFIVQELMPELEPSARGVEPDDLDRIPARAEALEFLRVELRASDRSPYLTGPAWMGRVALVSVGLLCLFLTSLTAGPLSSTLTGLGMVAVFLAGVAWVLADTRYRRVRGAIREFVLSAPYPLPALMDLLREKAHQGTKGADFAGFMAGDYQLVLDSIVAGANAIRARVREEVA